MIGKRQLALIEAARTQLGLTPAEVADFLEEEGGVKNVAELSIAGFNGFMDRCTIRGFRDRRRPVLSAETLQALDRLLDPIGMSDLEAATAMRSHGKTGDPRDLDGRGLLGLLLFAERWGSRVSDFIAARRSVTAKQLALLHVARKKVSHSEAELSVALQVLGGVNSAADLDQRGFDLMMALMRAFGFEWEERIIKGGFPPFGERPGFASAAQIALIRELWAEWSGAADDTALNKWLDRSFAVSALRFLKPAVASKAITALKTMKRRAVDRPRVTA